MTPTIRLATPQDLPSCLEIYRPYVERAATSFETSVPSEETFAKRVAEIQKRLPWLVLVGGGEVLGYAYAGPYRSRFAYSWSVETSIYMAESYRREGLGRKLYTKLLDMLCRQGFVNAYAVITLPNEPSVAFHEAFGFRHVGTFTSVGHKLGKWHDVGWWHFLLQEPAPTPSLPRPYRSEWLTP